jgi:hypothetical protein
MLILSIGAAAVATLLTAISAGQNAPVLFQKWQYLAWLSTVLTAIATAAGTIRQSLGVTEKSVKGATCVGRLKALEYALTVGTVNPPDAGQDV